MGPLVLPASGTEDDACVCNLFISLLLNLYTTHLDILSSSNVQNCKNIGHDNINKTELKHELKLVVLPQVSLSHECREEERVRHALGETP